MFDGTVLNRKTQTFDTRHWSPQQSYITGDVLARLLAEGWGLTSAKLVCCEGPAPMYLCLMERQGESMAVRVLDGPFVRSLARDLM